MSDLLYLNDNGGYVWVAYGITLAVVLWNVWAAHSRLQRNLRKAREIRSADAPRQPTVRQL